MIFPGGAAAGATQGEVKPVPVLATNCACGTRETLGAKDGECRWKEGQGDPFSGSGFCSCALARSPPAQGKAGSVVPLRCSTQGEVGAEEMAVGFLLFSPDEGGGAVLLDDFVFLVVEDMMHRKRQKLRCKM